jgi:hypothetical protein
MDAWGGAGTKDWRGMPGTQVPAKGLRPQSRLKTTGDEGGVPV